MQLHLYVKLETGQMLSGTLRLGRKIADGGMGSVWTAEHIVLGTEVAVKFMAGPWAAVPSARARFLREARMTANIDSPHVVRVLDCRHDEADEPYIVLELLHGENLEQRVRRHGPLSIFEVTEIVTQTCEALAATHEAGIVHRDLKPENVFLVSGATTFVKLLDYGVAKPMKLDECLEVDRLPAGTPQYMSPEHMFEPDATGARSDLFSLAAVAYFALTRRTPFDADSIEGMYFAIDGGAFPRPSALRPELPEVLDKWFEKALAHDPNQRFADARQMADALYDALRDTRTQLAGSFAAVDQAPASTREHPTLSEVGIPFRRVRGSRKSAIAALLLAAAATLLVWRESGPELQKDNPSTTALSGATFEAADAGTDAARPFANPRGADDKEARRLAPDNDPREIRAAIEGILAFGHDPQDDRKADLAREP